MKTLFLKLLLFFLCINYAFAYNKDYTKNKNVENFILELTKNSSYKKSELYKLFSNVKVQKYSLKVYKEKKKTKKVKSAVKKHGVWDNYEKYFLTSKRVNRGAAFMKKNKKTLNKAYKYYKVPPEYIAAIIGIETYFGKSTGNFPVFDSLVTLAFEKNRRNKFFKSELKQFLLLSKENKINPKKIYGSYAGAFGLVQFMPSSFNTTAVDFDKNGKIELGKEADAIGSVANYLNKSGWNSFIPTATRVSYKGKRFERFKTGFKYRYNRNKLTGIKPKSKDFFYKDKVHLIKLDRKNYDELWYGTKNFYVITRYNRSNYYAMAVHLLAQKIKKAYHKIN
jgi:membrane-bound lytic murein transglycosylase B